MSTSTSPIEPSAVRHASRRPAKVFRGHTDVVWCVAYFPDGQHVASTSGDKSVIIWDVGSGRQDGPPLQHASAVLWVAISPDGRRIASGLEGGGLAIWDALTRKVVHEIKGVGVWRLAYSPDGRWIATVLMGPGGAVWLWDADTGGPFREPLESDGFVGCVAFSPDGSRITAGLWDGSFQVIDIATGKSVVGPINGHTETVSSVVYSPDGHLLVTGSLDKSIRVWDSKTGMEVGKPMLGHEDDVYCISISADGRRIASAGLDRTVRVWDLETRLQVGDSFDADGWVDSVAFSPDDRYIVSDNTYDVCLWDTESLPIRGPFSPPTANNRNPPLRGRARSVTSSILDLPAVPAPVVPHQDGSSPSEFESLRRSSFDSILDPPVVEPGDRRLNKKRPHSPESIHRLLRLTGPHQDPRREQETSTVQPAPSGGNQSRIPADLPDSPPDLPLPLHERANSPASIERSPPTTSARNAPIQDYTHSVIPPILD